MNKTLVFFLALILLFGGMSVFAVAYRISRPGEETKPVTTKEIATVREYMKSPEGVPADELITDFTLTQQGGKPFGSEDLKGSVHIASFFFASCPGTCRAQNDAMRLLHRDYGSKGVKFLSITVDPENDSPEKLAEYAGLFGADPKEWLFLTGDLLYTRRIGAEIYQMHVDKGVHTNRFAIVDKAGKLRGSFEWQNDLEVAKLRKLIDQLIEEEPETTDSSAASEADARPSDTEALDENENDNQAPIENNAKDDGKAESSKSGAEAGDETQSSDSSEAAAAK